MVVRGSRFIRVHYHWFWVGARIGLANFVDCGRRLMDIFLNIVHRLMVRIMSVQNNWRSRIVSRGRVLVI